MAKEDGFGRDIKLRNGNVACRILPVKIHELDPEDIKLLETELGGVLRSVEFIYKESGVNRPLRANEKSPGKDQGLTTYRNQVNKVANSIKEIIYALKNPPSISGEKFQQTTAGVSPTTRKSVNKRVILSAALILVTLILIGIYYSKSYDLALSQLQKTLAINKYSLAEFYVGLCYMQKKDYAKALENFNNYGSTLPMGLSTEEVGLMIINCHALSGETAKAKAELREFLKQKPNPNPYWLSILYVALGDFDHAMIELERGYDMRTIHMMHINVNPHFDPLRQDPRFIALIKKMNF